MPHLILARHGESQFNAKSLWTGTWDVPLTEKGRGEAALMAQAVKHLKPVTAYTSALSRAADTLAIILKTNHWKPIIHADAALNERDYGELTGMNKWSVEERYGEDQFNKWRRGWNEPVPGGETLKTVSERAVPYFKKHILKDIQAGKDVIVVAHGNTLRTIIKYLDQLSNDEVQNLEMPFGQVLVYKFDDQARVTNKKIDKIESSAPPA